MLLSITDVTSYDWIWGKETCRRYHKLHKNADLQSTGGQSSEPRFRGNKEEVATVRRHDVERNITSTFSSSQAVNDVHADKGLKDFIVCSGRR